jgi:hypothetical protein
MVPGIMSGSTPRAAGHMVMFCACVVLLQVDFYRERRLKHQLRLAGAEPWAFLGRGRHPMLASSCKERPVCRGTAGQLVGSCLV